MTDGCLQWDFFPSAGMRIRSAGYKDINCANVLDSFKSVPNNMDSHSCMQSLTSSLRTILHAGGIGNQVVCDSRKESMQVI
eukprot:10306890-Karenia_brevis.AAC.1